MKVFEWIGKALDWINKNLSRIKTVGLILFIILFIISFCNNGCNRKQAEKLIEKITGLNITNDILQKQNKVLDDSLKNEIIKREALEKSKADLLAEKGKLEKDNARLRKDLAGIPQWLLNMPADSSYKFLNEVAYPFLGEKRFPFNEPQIKNIHADYIENIKLTGLVAVLDSQLVNCQKSSELAESISMSYKKSYTMSEQKVKNLEEVVSNSEQKAAVLEKDNKKQKNRRNVWRTIGIGEAIAILVLLL